jgi:hypothetical protein
MTGPSKVLRFPNLSLAPSSVRQLRALVVNGPAITTGSSAAGARGASSRLTTLQDANPGNLPDLWFSSTFPRFENGGGLSPREPKDERKAKLGKSMFALCLHHVQQESIWLTHESSALRILQDRLPTLLQSPLPQDILSSNISLHLFPSTHPHLPAVSGRVAYVAALWTAPVAWNRVPIVGNVKLEILSERMVDQPLHTTPRRAGAVGEQLIVRWRTIGKNKSWGLSFGNGDGSSSQQASSADAATPGSPVSEANTDGEFTGLFIFDFDKEGRVLSHTIEHVQEGGQWEQGVGAKFVGLTDWLLRGIKRTREGRDAPCPAYARRQR